jgi:hypothetical protein
VNDLIAQFIRCQFVALGRRSQRPALMSALLGILHSLVAEARVLDTILNVKCSNFRLLHDLSFRRATAARRPNINDRECASFTCALDKAQHDFDPRHVVNFHIGNEHLVMLRDRCQDVNCYVDGDAKANLTFFTSTSVDGSRLPLILIACRTANKHFSVHPDYPHWMLYSPHGWLTEPLMKRHTQ